MNILHLNDCRFDTRVILSGPNCLLNLHGETFAVSVRRVGEQWTHPVYEAVDAETGKVLLEWSSINMMPAMINHAWFTIQVHGSYTADATLIVPELGFDEEEIEDDDE